VVEPKEEKRITVRVSPSLHDKILLAAGQRNLSINGFIIQSLERSVDPVSVESRLAIVEEKLRYLTDGP
jgi:uncharacterized protein (DUF1778 family)